MELYRFLDGFFFVFHAILTTFGALGWIWRKTRKIHLVYMLATGFSWFVLGIFFGFGYCFLTDWHWQVKVKLGETDIPRSYVKFFLDAITGLDFDALLVDTVVLAVFFFALASSIVLTVLNLIKSRKSRAGQPPVTS